jgi:hypothetical protein|nr:MAG TPA: hypothetical protein [Caudoviricetes sp.]
MKKTYLDKYPYELKNIDDTHWSILIDPIDHQAATDLVLNFGTTDNRVSIEGIPLKVRSHKTVVSEYEDGMQAVLISAHIL